MGVVWCACSVVWCGVGAGGECSWRSFFMHDHKEQAAAVLEYQYWSTATLSLPLTLSIYGRLWAIMRCHHDRDNVKVKGVMVLMMMMMMMMMMMTMMTMMLMMVLMMVVVVTMMMVVVVVRRRRRQQ